MNIRRQDQDDEVIRLLGKLNDAAPVYPSSMFNNRRAAVMAAFAALNLGAATAGLGLIAHLVKVIKAMGVVEKVILGVEVAAVTGMTAYGAATAYVYRDQIRQVLEANLGIVTNTPFPSLSVPAGGFSAGATEAALTETPTPTPTPTGTLYYTVTEPGVPGETTVAPPEPSATPPPPVASSTPQPPPKATATNCVPNEQGKCLGKITPHPTKTP